MVFDGDTLVKNFRHYLGNKTYFAEQLCFDIVEGMNNNTTDLFIGRWYFCLFIFIGNKNSRDKG
jgi:hypothetical protein